MKPQRLRTILLTVVRRESLRLTYQLLLQQGDPLGRRTLPARATPPAVPPLLLRGPCPWRHTWVWWIPWLGWEVRCALSRQLTRQDAPRCAICEDFAGRYPSARQRGHGALKVLSDPQCDHRDQREHYSQRRLSAVSSVPEGES